jgi:SAM-dependent methyltransferase
MIPYRLMYRLGFTPWERRPIPSLWQRIVEGSDALPPGRALDVGCGTGRDAVYLAKRGWKVTAVDGVEEALAKARQRAAQEGVQVQWIAGDVSDLAGLGLEPGYTLLYDFGCIHGLPDAARASALDALTRLAAPEATLVVVAFKRGRRMILPRGIDKEELTDLLGDAWELVGVESVVDASTPPPIRRAGPTLYHLRRTGAAAEPDSSVQSASVSA